jgi:hypothetical protein
VPRVALDAIGRHVARRSRGRIASAQAVALDPSAPTSLVFIEETLPDRGAAHWSCRGAHADTRLWSRCCRDLASPEPRASWLHARSHANRGRGAASAAQLH